MAIERDGDDDDYSESREGKQVNELLSAGLVTADKMDGGALLLQ